MSMTDENLQHDEKEKPQPLAESTSSIAGAGQISEPIALDHDRFSVLGAVGIYWSSTAAPLSICSSLQLVMGVGGSPFYFWAFCVAAFFQFTVALSLAELASAYPHTSGQAYWVTKLAPPNCSRLLTYWVGICTFWGWLFGLAGTSAFGGEFVLAIGTLTVNSFTRELWQVYLVVIAMAVLSFIVNTVGIRILPKITFPNVVFMNAATLFIFVTLLAKASPKASASTVFVNIINYTGWSSDGVVFLLSLLPGSIAVSLFDAATHASDEMPRPAEQVPKVMIGTTILNIVSTFIMLIGVLFCLSQPENLLEPMAGLAFIQLCWDAWPNQGFVTTIAVIYSLLNMFAVITMVYTCSRLIWSFAQTGGFHRRSWLLSVNQQLRAPVNAVIVTVILMLIANLLVLGPSTFLNAMFGAGGFFFANSYCVPIVLLLLRGRKSLPENRSFHLGRFGTAINLMAISYCVVLAIIINFPTLVPVQPSTMNWTSACIGIVIFVTLGNWILVRKSYQPPEPLYEEPNHNGLDASTRSV
ncbi:amino acid/polyamine transporter I [Dactylonectria macrodidyma]|uniref:Amino acid/polyamine transporter I n=1 Tax=Dactylonectria macrodidyma TaxID=307937 RepID=A0A9P9EJB0_9HYPO|nr:amino acid/polyamine transporter I [Dactylonectria macrodidyma]